MVMTQNTVLQKRTSSLIASFPACLDEFSQLRMFTGPSIYFHQKTILLLKKYENAQAAIKTTDFLESLYATLTSWGMHRMGKTNAKLVEFEVMRNSLQELLPQIERIQYKNLLTLEPKELPEIAEQIWEIINNLRIGIGRTKIVVGSKTLHHILPNLVPPIDREYTLQFFYRNKNISRAENQYFKEIFPLYYQIASACKEEINSRIALKGEMDTSPTKVIDNAIVGYIWKYVKNSEQLENSANDINNSNIEINHQLTLHQEATLNREETIIEQIMRAVYQLGKQGIIIFTRKDIRDELGLSQEQMNASYSPIFQGMHVDQPGGAPNVGIRFKGVFKRVEYGKYRLTEKGTQLIQDLFH